MVFNYFMCNYKVGERRSIYRSPLCIHKSYITFQSCSLTVSDPQLRVKFYVKAVQVTNTDLSLESRVSWQLP